jgi:hypothetical protein
MFIYVIRNIACGFIVLEVPVVIFITRLKSSWKSQHFIIHKNYWNVHCKQITHVIFIPILLNNWRLKYKWYFYIKCYLIVLDFKFSLFWMFYAFFTGPPASEYGTDRVSETLAYKIQKPVNHPEESIQRYLNLPNYCMNEVLKTSTLSNSYVFKY